MSDDSDDQNESGKSWVFYRDRPEWSDVKPIPQDDGPYPVVTIAYSEKFQDIYDYLRAILAKKELSDRAFKLSEDAVLVNSANYTAWHFRRVLLKSLNKDLREELKFIENIIYENMKCYQVWYHRQVLVEWLNDSSFEKQFTESVLEADPKNYHAWQHRQWVIQKFNLWDGEIEYLNSLLKTDVRNNSAWNQRYFVVTRNGEINDDDFSSEIKYTMDSILKAPHNESPWNYLRGILQDRSLKYPVVADFVEKLYNEGGRSPHLLAFIVDSIEEELLAGGDPSLCQKALELCDLLASKYDIIRCEYWNFIARNIGNMYGPEEARVRRSQSHNLDAPD